MRVKSASHVCLIAFGSLTVSMTETRAREAKTQVIVCVGNYAAVPSATLAAAQQVVIRIFRHAGVDLEMVNDTRLGEKPASGGKCGHSSTRLALNLSIIDGSMAPAVPCPRRIMGFALATGAFVCFHHVRDHVPERSLLSVILGHVMAHELGHLLLGKGHGATSSLMSPSLHDTDFKRACQGQLLFQQLEAEQIRTRLQAPIRARP